MRSRFPSMSVQDYCFNPLIIHHDNGEFDLVPCGKCDGCLLHRQNSWSLRLQDEIENSKFSIFFTLTYSNKYLPKLIKDDSIIPLWHSDHDSNIRFNGTKDVPRDRGKHIISFRSSCDSVPVTNLPNIYIAYPSKRDIQLWLKFIRKDINELFPNENQSLRYYIISELGATRYRPHYHGIVFLESHKISEYLLAGGLYSRWQMCDPQLFSDNCHYCDSGAAGYVTNYLTCNNNLPSVYRNAEIKPFRLASKNPAIGFNHFDKKEISESISEGIIEYHKSIPRIDKKYIFRYPSDYLSTLFPKCYRYGEKSFYELLSTYGILYQLVVEDGASYLECSLRLSKELRSQDWTCARKCYNFCLENGCEPEYYVWLVDRYFYKRGMAALRMQYELQEKLGFKLSTLSFYVNFGYRLQAFQNGSFNAYQRLVLFNLVSPLGLDLDDLLDYDYREFISRPDDSLYRLEVSDILDDMIKLPKYNELVGVSPVVNSY